MSMRRSSGRAQVEPLAALAAVFAVTVGLAIYAGAVDGVLEGSDRDVSAEVLDHAVREAGPPGLVTVEGFEHLSVAPAGWQANLTLRTSRGRYTVGPTPPERSQRASRTVAVRHAPGRIDPGVLVVEVWQ
jgi:hypothetical protein